MAEKVTGRWQYGAQFIKEWKEQFDDTYLQNSYHSNFREWYFFNIIVRRKQWVNYINLMKFLCGQMYSRILLL
jgi:hypothetical protein